ncbi:MAG: DUF4157 domain-containing protein [Myxococcales bacterium]|nr:DUF4157 domain-containing protein [Myxococcales bacterium]
MTHQREQDYEPFRLPSSAAHDLAIPGRASASAGLAGPGQPVASGIVQRKASAAAGARDAQGVTADAAEHVATAAGSSGTALPGELRSRFESSLDTDLSSVRVHTGAESETAAHAVGAKAYTVGQDIHFGKGHFDPHSDRGQELLAHEVAHTVQQRGGAPSRQNKLEVSSEGDSAELEADRAAQAMVSGRPASVTTAGSLARKILREEEEEMPQVKSLQEHIEADDRPKSVDRDTQYSYQDVNDPGGNAKTADPVVANAKAQGALSELQRLSEEFTIAKPLFMSWIESAAAATTVAKASGLNLGTPEAYRPAVQKMGDEMRSGSEKGRQLAALAASQNKISAASVKSAGLGITEAVAKVSGARAKLSAHHARLEQKAKSKELQDKKDELAKVQAEIKMVANLLKQTAELATSLSKATTLFNIVSTTGKAYEKGYNEITGTTDTTEALLQWAFYQPKVDAINKGISGLNSQIQGLSVQIDSFDGAGFTAELTAAKTSFERASVDLLNEKQAYMAKMQQLGRDWDQKALKPGEKSIFKGATAGEGELHSMEGILSVSAALQARGAAREAFSAVAANSPHLSNAPAIVDKALGGGAGVWVRDDLGSREFVWLPQDHPYMNPSDDLVAKAKELRTTSGNFTAAIKHIKEDGAKDAAVESAWQSMIQQATGGGGSQVR